MASVGDRIREIREELGLTLDKLAVGQIQLANVPAAVDKAPMSTSLLGMAFLKRLESFEVKGDQLTLRWRG